MAAYVALNALPIVNGTTPLAPISAIPVVITTGGVPPVQAVNAQRVKDVTSDATFPRSPVAPIPVAYVPGDPNHPVGPGDVIPIYVVP